MTKLIPSKQSRTRREMKAYVHAVGTGFGGGPEAQQPVFNAQEWTLAKSLKQTLNQQERDDLWIPECASCALCHGYPLRQQSELTRQLGVCGCLVAIDCELGLLEAVSDEPTSDVIAEIATLCKASQVLPEAARIPHKIAFPQQKRAHTGRFEMRAQHPLKLHRQARLPARRRAPARPCPRFVGRTRRCAAATASFAERAKIGAALCLIWHLLRSTRLALRLSWPQTSPAPHAMRAAIRGGLPENR